MSDIKETLTQAACDEIDTWIAKYPADRKQSAVIPALHVVQDHHGGSLTDELMDAVAAYLEIPKIAVYEVATFYNMYELKPVGRHKLGVCNSISCMLSGSEELIGYIKQKYNVNVGETTADGKFTLKKIECLGACRHAPVAHMDKAYHECLTPEKVDQLIEGLE